MRSVVGKTTTREAEKCAKRVDARQKAKTTLTKMAGRCRTQLKPLLSNLKLNQQMNPEESASQLSSRHEAALYPMVMDETMSN
jgi:hypothetical protein